jgi:hypothetical protein
VSTAELIERIKALPKNQRARIAEFIAQLDASTNRRRRNARDLAIINRRAARLNSEATDVVDYQVPL